MPLVDVKLVDVASTVCDWSSLLQAVSTDWQCYTRDALLYWGN